MHPTLRGPALLPAPKLRAGIALELRLQAKRLEKIARVLENGEDAYATALETANEVKALNVRLNDLRRLEALER